MDSLLLHALAGKQRFKSLSHAVPQGMVAADTQALLQWYGVYWAAFPEREQIDVDELMSLVRLRSAHASPEAVHITLHLIEQLRNPPEDHAVQGILGQLYELDLSGRAAALISKYQNGDEVDLAYELQRLSQAAVRAKASATPDDFIMTPIGELLSEVSNDQGLKFRRWAALREHILGLQGGASIAIASRPDKGKCQAPNTPVLLADGRTVLARDVRVGDVLAGPYMNNTVLSLTMGTDAMYKVSYPWGESYTVNAPHILSLKRSKADGKHKTGDVLNVPVCEYVQWPESRKKCYKGWKAGIELPESQGQPVPPYLLGLWLGDGTTTKPEVTTMDGEVLAAFVAEYGEPSSIQPAGAASSYYFSGALRAGLEACGVFGNKHIPDAYLKASRRQRLELLAGIIDSDGYAGDVYEIVTKLDSLKDGYVWLARSLGFHAVASRSFKRATNSNHAGDWYWRVRIGSEAFGVVPVRLARHAGSTRARKRLGLHFGISVEAVGLGEYVGWELSGDRLYMLGDFTVTHNTSLIAAMLTDFAPQVSAMYGGARPLMWLNNEGSGKRIIPRIYQAALGKDLNEIIALSNANQLVPQYTTAIGGHADLIRVKDMHGATLAQIEQVLETHRPAVVVADMLANFRLSSAVNGANKADAVEQIWQEWRELMVRHDCIGLATIQISVEGGNMLYPAYSALKDSKTGVQGATDVIIMMGSLDNPDAQTIRGLSSPKNKFAAPGKPSCFQSEMYFDGARCVFADGSAPPTGAPT